MKKNELNWYKEQLEFLKKQRFSGTGEKVVNGQLNLFNEVEDIADHSQEEVIEEEVVVKKKRKKRKKRIIQDYLSSSRNIN